MVIRIIKIIFGIALALSAVSEYKNYVQQTGSGSIIILCVVGLLALFGLLLAYSGIKNKPFFSFISRRKTE
ncbi:MAG: hypothetical protein PVG39_28780 [Desulfobacteraceae bacterium]